MKRSNQNKIRLHLAKADNIPHHNPSLMTLSNLRVSMTEPFKFLALHPHSTRRNNHTQVRQNSSSTTNGFRTHSTSTRGHPSHQVCVPHQMYSATMKRRVLHTSRLLRHSTNRQATIPAKQPPSTKSPSAHPATTGHIISQAHIQRLTASLALNLPFRQANPHHCSSRAVSPVQRKWVWRVGAALYWGRRKQAGDIEAVSGQAWRISVFLCRRRWMMKMMASREVEY